MSGSVRLALSGKLPREGHFRPMRAGRRKFSVAKLAGQFHVTDSLCPHKELPFGKGILSGGQIVCPWHGWCFNPASGQQGGQKLKGGACLQIYPSTQRDGELFLILV